MQFKHLWKQALYSRQLLHQSWCPTVTSLSQPKKASFNVQILIKTSIVFARYFWCLRSYSSWLRSYSAKIWLLFLKINRDWMWCIYCVCIEQVDNYLSQTLTNGSRIDFDDRGASLRLEMACIAVLNVVSAIYHSWARLTVVFILKTLTIWSEHIQMGSLQKWRQGS